MKLIMLVMSIFLTNIVWAGPCAKLLENTQNSVLRFVRNGSKFKIEHDGRMLAVLERENNEGIKIQYSFEPQPVERDLSRPRRNMDELIKIADDWGRGPLVEQLGIVTKVDVTPDNRSILVFFHSEPPRLKLSQSGILIHETFSASKIVAIDNLQSGLDQAHRIFLIDGRFEDFADDPGMIPFMEYVTKQLVEYILSNPDSP